MSLVSSSGTTRLKDVASGRPDGEPTVNPVGSVP